jgi:glycosyltransferase involved in cell wall biosynthesis
MKLSVVVPTINSSRIIRKNLKEIERTLYTIPELEDFEILAAAQTSKDNTFDILKKTANDKIKPVLIIPKGKGIGLTLGIKKAVFEWVLMIDDDIPYDIKRFIRLAHNKYTHEADIIIASRYAPGAKYNSTIKRKIASFGYRTLIKLLFGIPQKDTQAGMKLIRRSAFEKMGFPKEHGYVWDTELLYKANKKHLKIAEIPVALLNSEKNQLNLKKAVPSILKDMINLRMRV